MMDPRRTPLLSYLLAGASLLSQLPGALTHGSHAGALVPRTWDGKSYGCKCYFGDDCWPAANKWASLNTTVAGNLAVIIPPESACHNVFEGTLGTIPTYDAAKCADVTANYPKEQWINDQDATLMWKYFTNSSCVPTTDPSTSCTPGYYGTYVIRATEKAHIKAGVDFAREHNLRLIVRNTGHDFMGRSTGWGALVINTHSFQDVKFVKSWKGGQRGYRGSAVTVGAGVQGRALLREAVTQDPPVTVVTGECPTVGIAGGFVQGGGHGPLTTIFGFAADNALSFDVITAEGKFVTANETKNPELFWGLKGGGPGSYGVVVSASFKTFPEYPSAGATLYINSTLTTDTAVFWEGVRIFHSHANYFVDNGLYVYFSVGPGSLRVRPFVAYNQTAAELETILAPLRADLTAAGVPFYSAPANQYATFFDLYVDLFEDESAGPPTLTSGWTFGRADIEDNNDGIIKAFKTAISPRADLVDKGYMVGHLFGAGHASQPAGISATNPRFRDSSDLLLYLLPLPTDATLAQKADIQDLLTNTVDRAMKDAGPNGCAYVNEADPYQADWQTHFWGPTVYPRLQSLKEAWDPNGVFYALSTPGTEQWDVIEYGTRLCKRL
jgi:FAD/FMN-containing dehydrogenase